MKSPRVLIVVALLFGAAGPLGCGSEPEPRNLPPVIDGLTANAEQLRPGGETTLQLTARDQDGSSAASAEDGHLPAGLNVEWTVSKEDWSISGDGASATVTAADSYDSRTEVKAVITDADGASATATVALRTGQNARPQIEQITASPNPAAPGDTITLEATAGDRRGDDLTYTWSAPDDWSLKAQTGKAVELTAPDEDGASAELTLEVSDDFGGASSRTVRVQTRDNAAPTIASMTAAPPQVAPGGSITVKVDAADPDGDELQYDWTAPEDWSVEGEDAEVKLQAPQSFGAAGEVAVTVTDPRGHTATARVLVSTTTNSGPAINSLTALPQQVTRGETSDLKVEATDPDGDSLQYKWSVADPAWSIAANGDAATLTASPKPGASTTATVEVTDGNGGSSTASIVVSTAPNQPPNLASLNATPSTTGPGGVVTVQASAGDPDGDTLQYTWRKPGDWSLSSNGAKATLTAPDRYGAQATVGVTVADGFGGSTTGSVTIYTDRNLPPSLSGVTANPAVVKPGGTAKVAVQANDPNGDKLGYSWSLPQGWTKSGSGASIDVTAPSKRDARGIINVTVDDGHGAKTTGSVAVQTENNTAPIILSSSASKTTLAPDDKTTLSVDATDVEGDKLSYTWTLPSGWSGSSNTSTITVTAPRQYDKTVQVTAEVSDGTDTATKTFQLKTVANKAPVVSSLTAQPNPVDGGQATTVTVNASDPLGDSLGYAWTLSNNAWSLNGSGTSVQLTAPNKQSSTKVTVTVDDGHGGTTTETTTVNSQVRLYNFSAHTFTNCGQNGHIGPTLSQCRSRYSTSWDGNGGYFTMKSRGIQEWTVPETATYRLEAAGAGYNGGGDASHQLGAVMRADFQLNRGDVLRILVGQMSNGECGGSGGTFVQLNNNPLVVAGGSGGQNGDNHSKLRASTSTNGQPGNVGAGGSNGSGGKQSCGGGSGYGGGAGGGYSSNGIDNGSRYGCSGKAFVNGGVGGSNSCGDSVDDDGGFGGGGSGYCSDEPGAGGGYSGGGGGGYEDNCGRTSTRYGGGGGSFIANSGTNTTKSVSQKGHGYLKVTKK